MIGTGLTWAVGWAGVSVLLSLLGGTPFGFLGLVALSGAVRGFIAGGAFAVILSVAERKHTLEDLSLRRVALWGGIGGGFLFIAVLPFLLPAAVPLGGMVGPTLISVLLGAGFASGSVALARKEERRLIAGGE
jgi:hypothetical protein